MLLPTTYALPPVSALIMLAGIYYGAQYGGSTTAILVNMPGESSSVVTVPRRLPDGAQGPGRRRRSPPRRSARSSPAASRTLIVAAFAPPLSELALKFGPAEYFSLMVLGLIGAVVLAHGSLLKAIAMIVLGLLLGIVGTDVNSGVARFDFGIPELSDGIGFVVVAMGLFGFAEIIANLEPTEKREVFTDEGQGPAGPPRRRLQGRVRPRCCAARRSARCSASCPAAARCCRRSRPTRSRRRSPSDPRAVRQGRDPGRRRPRVGQQRRRADLVHPAADARHPAERGDGADGRRDDDPQHPAGPAGDDVSNPQLFWGLIASMWVGNLMLVVLNLPLIGMWIKLLTVPYRCCSRRSCCSARSACTRSTTTRFDVMHDGALRLHRLRVRQARDASRRRCCWASSSGR